MLRKCKKLLAFLLALALVFTTFSSDYASAKVYAEEDTEQNDNSEEEEVDEEDEDEEDEEDEEESDDESDDEEDADDESDDESGDNEEDGEETPEGETPEAETPEEAEEESDDSEEGLIVITYVAQDGGSVSNSKETFDPMSEEEITLDGSTATADEGYKFTGWTHGEETITEDATYVPVAADITENIEFTANFEAVETVVEPEEPEMPEKKFDGDASGLSVHVEAPEGAFPAGTKMIVSSVTDESILESMKSAVEGDNSEQHAVAVDISFEYEGKEIEPKKAISVKITSSLIKDADDAAVVHVPDDGEPEVIDDANISGSTAKFTSDEFSVYGLVYSEDGQEIEIFTRTYKFEDLNNEGEWVPYSFTTSDGKTVDNQIIKNNDALDAVETPVHDTREFLGWFIYADGEYKSKVTFGEAITDITKNETVTVRAKYNNYFIVSYVDEDGANITSEVASADDGEYTISQNYTAKDIESGFIGWKTEDTDKIATDDLKDKYFKGDTIHISGDITFKAYTAKGAWLIFDANDAPEEGESYSPATYTLSQFVEIGAVPTEPEDPTRTGYTFQGWYEKQDGTGEAFDFTKELEKSTTVYAKWQNVTQAKYKIVIWAEKEGTANKHNGYAFNKEYEFTGTVGQNIATAARLNIQPSDYRISVNGSNYEIVGFKPKATTDGDTKIKAEGNAVLNVYFDRIVYNFKFILSHKDGTRIYKYEDKNVNPSISNLWELDRNHALNSTSYYPSDNTHYDGGKLYYQITAKYGQDISGMWPTYESFGLAEDRVDHTLISWVLMPGAGAIDTTVTQGGYTVKGIIPILDTKILGNWKDPDGNYVNARYNDNPKTYKYNIYVESLTDEGKEYRGQKYVLHESSPVTAKSTSAWTGQKSPSFKGFKFKGNDYYREDVGGPNNNYQINFYYERLKYSIIYEDGVYETADGTSYAKKPTFKTVENVPYESDISSYKDYTPSSYEGFIFAGWYSDPGCTTPAAFGKMDADNMIVYAKWTQKQYRVFVHPGQGLAETSQLVGLGGRVNVAVPEKEGLEFVGWTTDEAGKKSFNADAVVLNDTTTVPYTDKIEEDEGKDYIDRKLDLYGVWRSKLDGADGIGIEYAIDDTVIIEKDDKLYKDNTGAIAKAFPSTATVPENMRFDHWAVQSWNGTTYIDSDDIVKAGRVFKVYKNRAKEDKISETVSEYTIRLRAVFVDDDSEIVAVTKIVFDGNGGTTNKSTDTTNKIFVSDDKKTVTYKDYQINKGLVVTQEGFTYANHDFLGWTDEKPEEGKELTPKAEFALESTIGADNLDPKDNTLYAVWKANTGAYSIRYFMGDASKAFYEIPYDNVPIDGTTKTVADGTGVGQRDYKRPDGYKTGVVTPSDGIVIIPSTFDQDGNITNRQYIDVRYAPITVTVTVKGKTYSLPYNGTEQAAPYEANDKGYEVVSITSNADAADGVTIPTADKVKTTKAIGAKGTDVDEYLFGLTTNDFDLDDEIFNKENGNVTVVIEQDGKLNITKITATVKITGHYNTTTFDNEPHSVTGYDVEITDTVPNTTIYKESDFTFTFKGKTGAEAIAATKTTRTDVGKTMMGLIPENVEQQTFVNKYDKFENTNKNFDVTFTVIDGYQEITPVDTVKVTITGKTETKVFNNDDQYVYGFDEIKISDPLYTMSDFTYKNTAVSMDMTKAFAKGKNVNAEGYPMGLVDTDFKNINKNFDKVIFEIKEDGKLIITPAEVVVNIKGKEETKQFTGEELTTTGFEMTSESEFFNVSDIKFDIDKDGTADANRNTAIAKGTAPRSNPYPMNLNVGTFTPAADGTYDENCQFYSTNKNINVTFKVENGSLTITDAENPIPLALTIASDPIVSPYNGLLQKYTMVPGVEPVAENGVAATIDTLRRLIDNFIVIRAQGAEAGEVEFDYKGKTYVAKNVKVTAEGKDVGDYSFTVVGKILIYLDDDEVTNSFAIDDSALANKLTITKAQMNFIADNKSKVAGQVDPTYTATIADLLGDDVYDAGTIASYFVDKELYVFSRDAGETAGNYNIYVKTKEIEDAPELIQRLMSNYEWNYKPGILTITAGGGGGDDTPDTPDTPTTIPDAPVALAPSPAVLGAQRDIPVDGPAVLGARRAGTDDSTNRTARAFIILVSAAVALSLVIAGKKKRKNEEE